jgi:hypothetical protein
MRIITYYHSFYGADILANNLTTVIKDIIAVRHSAIDEALDKCDKLNNENNYLLSFLLRGGYIG